jgi:hypothetical protein
MMKHYEHRDIIAQGKGYTDHVQAMTAEGLHDKGDIAAELAHRDERIAALEAELAKVKVENVKLNEALHKSFAYSDDLEWALDAQNGINKERLAELKAMEAERDAAYESVKGANARGDALEEVLLDAEQGLRVLKTMLRIEHLPGGAAAAEKLIERIRAALEE